MDSYANIQYKIHLGQKAVKFHFYVLYFTWLLYKPRKLQLLSMIQIAEREPTGLGVWQLAFFFFNSFMEIHFSYHTIYPHKVYYSMTFTYSQNCASITIVSFKAFSLLQKESLYPLSSYLSPFTSIGTSFNEHCFQHSSMLHLSVLHHCQVIFHLCIYCILFIYSSVSQWMVECFPFFDYYE